MFLYVTLFIAAIIVISLVARLLAFGKNEPLSGQERSALFDAFDRVERGAEVFKMADASPAHTGRKCDVYEPVLKAECYGLTERLASQRAQSRWREFEAAFKARSNDLVKPCLVRTGFHFGNNVCFEWVVVDSIENDTLLGHFEDEQATDQEIGKQQLQFPISSVCDWVYWSAAGQPIRACG